MSESEALLSTLGLEGSRWGVIYKRSKENAVKCYCMSEAVNARRREESSV